MLSKRELDVLRLLAAGATTVAIATELRLSSHTVPNHVRSICEKLRAPNRPAAVIKAAQLDVVELPL